jgi:serralysin
MSQANPYEQLFLELINTERAKVGAQPLAFDGSLNTAAELHSQWMIATDTFSHTGSSGTSATQRMVNAGYALTGSWMTGENIAWASLRGDPGYVDEVYLLHTNLMNSSGHRANILNASFREIGVGYEIGQYGSYTGAFVTEDFAKSGSAVFVTGVAFDDKDGDKFYDVGEGLSGLTVTATSTTGAKYTTTTEAAGGYDIALSAGTYTVAFSGANIAAWSKTVTVGSYNVKVDLVDPAAPTGTITPTPPTTEPTTEPTAPTSPTVPADPTLITGTANGETLQGTTANDTMSGLGGNDVLYGNAGADRIDGGSGNDKLYGGAGADVLTGGTGYDTFVFDSAFSGGVDQITDFDHTYDTIQLDNDVFTTWTGTGTLYSSMFYSGAAAHDSTDRIIYNPSTGAVLYDPDGTGAAAPVHFAQLQPNLYVTYSDFVVIA